MNSLGWCSLESGKLRVQPCPGEGEECHSFLHSGLSGKAVHLAKSKAFIRKGSTDIANPADRKRKQDFAKCAWKEESRKCEPTDRTTYDFANNELITIPGLTGEHETIPLTFVDKTIPGAREQWCRAHEASHHNMEWVAASKECHYGCNAIHSEKECNGAEDHFRIKDGARPCPMAKYWDSTSETCVECQANMYQWHYEHFLDSCYQCPYHAGKTQFKDEDEAHDACLRDCFQRKVHNGFCEVTCVHQCYGNCRWNYSTGTNECFKWY